MVVNTNDDFVIVAGQEERRITQSTFETAESGLSANEFSTAACVPRSEDALPLQARPNIGAENHHLVAQTVEDVHVTSNGCTNQQAENGCVMSNGSLPAGEENSVCVKGNESLVVGEAAGVPVVPWQGGDGIVNISPAVAKCEGSRVAPVTPDNPLLHFTQFMVDNVSDEISTSKYSTARPSGSTKPDAPEQATKPDAVDKSVRSGASRPVTTPEDPRRRGGFILPPERTSTPLHQVLPLSPALRPPAPQLTKAQFCDSDASAGINLTKPNISGIRNDSNTDIWKGFVSVAPATDLLMAATVTAQKPLQDKTGAPATGLIPQDNNGRPQQFPFSHTATVPKREGLTDDRQQFVREPPGGIDSKLTMSANPQNLAGLRQQLNSTEASLKASMANTTTNSLTYFTPGSLNDYSATSLAACPGTGQWTTAFPSSAMETKRQKKSASRPTKVPAQKVTAAHKNLTGNILASHLPAQDHRPSSLERRLPSTLPIQSARQLMTATMDNCYNKNLLPEQMSVGHSQSTCIVYPGYSQRDESLSAVQRIMGLQQPVGLSYYNCSTQGLPLTARFAKLETLVKQFEMSYFYASAQPWIAWYLTKCSEIEFQRQNNLLHTPPYAGVMQSLNAHFNGERELLINYLEEAFNRIVNSGTPVTAEGDKYTTTPPRRCASQSGSSLPSARMNSMPGIVSRSSSSAVAAGKLEDRSWRVGQLPQAEFSSLQPESSLKLGKLAQTTAGGGEQLKQKGTGASVRPSSNGKSSSSSSINSSSSSVAPARTLRFNDADILGDGCYGNDDTRESGFHEASEFSCFDDGCSEYSSYPEKGSVVSEVAPVLDVLSPIFQQPIDLEGNKVCEGPSVQPPEGAEPDTSPLEEKSTDCLNFLFSPVAKSNIANRCSSPLKTTQAPSSVAVAAAAAPKQMKYASVFRGDCRGKEGDEDDIWSGLCTAGLWTGMEATHKLPGSQGVQGYQVQTLEGASHILEDPSMVYATRTLMTTQEEQVVAVPAEGQNYVIQGQSSRTRQAVPAEPYSYMLQGQPGQIKHAVPPESQSYVAQGQPAQMIHTLPPDGQNYVVQGQPGQATHTIPVEGQRYVLQGQPAQSLHSLSAENQNCVFQGQPAQGMQMFGMLDMNNNIATTMSSMMVEPQDSTDSATVSNPLLSFTPSCNQSNGQSGMMVLVNQSDAVMPGFTQNGTITPSASGEGQASSSERKPRSRRGSDTAGTGRKHSPSSKRGGKGKCLDASAVKMMTSWYEHNVGHPYPSQETAEYFAKIGGLAVEQVKKWFANKRMRNRNTKSLREIAQLRRRYIQIQNKMEWMEQQH